MKTILALSLLWIPTAYAQDIQIKPGQSIVVGTDTVTCTGTSGHCHIAEECQAGPNVTVSGGWFVVDSQGNCMSPTYTFPDQALRTLQILTQAGACAGAATGR